MTDGPPATALGFNPPSPGAMSKPPRGHNEPILTPWLLTRYIITGLYVGASTIGIMMWWLTDHGVYPNFGYIIERTVFSKLIGIFGRQVPAFVEPSQFTWSECKEWTECTACSECRECNECIECTACTECTECTGCTQCSE